MFKSPKGSRWSHYYVRLMGLLDTRLTEAVFGLKIYIGRNDEAVVLMELP